MGGAYPIAASVAAALAVSLLIDGHGASRGFARCYLRRLSYALGRTVRSASQAPCIAFLLEHEASSRCVDDMRIYLVGKGFAPTRQETAAVLLALVLLSMLAGAVLAGSPAGSAVGLACAAAAMRIRSSRRKKARDRALSEEMPAVFRSLAISLGSGLTLSQAIAYVGSRGDGEASRAFARCSLKLTCGDSYEDALAQLVRELDSPGIGLLSSALAISHQTGSPLHGLFMRSAELVERAGELERMLAVKTAQVRLSVRIVCLLPALLVCMLLMISPDFQAGIATPAGIMSVLLAACMDAAAVIIVRTLSKGII